MKQLVGCLVGLLTSLALAPIPARACLNDRDTLAEEARGLPDVVRVVTGRFERNPPLYYEMRIDRESADLKTHPTRLSEYNDVAVACDRIGRDDDAIAWMTRKRAQLDQIVDKPSAYAEDWYTYWADLGTCRIHRWIRGGGDRKQLAEAILARDEIAQALKIKPDAHFGREKYQLKVIDWMIEPDTPISTSESALGESILYDGDAPPKSDDVQRGLTGLIVLGSAWESPDMFGALSMLMAHRRDDRLSELCMLRVLELEVQGRKPMESDTGIDPALLKRRLVGDDDIVRQYKMLRAEADQWQEKRTAFMMIRLNAGRHPDTDPTFWDGYTDPGPPVLTVPLDRRIELWGRPYFGYHWFPRNILVIAIILLPLLWLFRRDYRNRREKRRIRAGWPVDRKTPDSPGANPQ